MSRWLRDTSLHLQHEHLAPNCLSALTPRPSQRHDVLVSLQGCEIQLYYIKYIEYLGQANVYFTLWMDLVFAFVLEFQCSVN